MNAGNVAAFACGRPHPQLGEDVACLRQKHHAGDHRSEYRGSLKEWPDPPVPPWHPGGTGPATEWKPGKVHGFEVRGGWVDEVTETWLEGEGRRPLFGYVPATVLEAAVGLVWVLVVVALVVYIT